MIRTGGPNVTEDVLAELVVSTRVLGSKEIMLLNHTGCGFTTFTDAELNAKFSKLTGDTAPAPMRFFAFTGSGAANQGPDQDGQVASLDFERRSCAGLHF